MDDRVFAEFRAAVDRAEADQGLMEKALRERCGETDAAKRQVAVCPWCQGRKTLGYYPHDGKIFFRCFKDGCPAKENTGPLTKFLMFDRGLDWIEAGREVLRMAGIADPSADDGGAESQPAAKPADEPKGDKPLESVPAFIRLPENGLNVYEAAWLLLGLTDKHRRELRVKRGMSDGWIDALGLRSATRHNRQLLAPLLDQFEPRVLLQSGVCTRNGDGTLRFSDSLCGRMKKCRPSPRTTSKAN